MLSKFANSGAMWLSDWWQFAQMTADTSWKFTRPVERPEMLWNGHTPMYGAAPPTSCGAAPISTGNFAQSNVSWTQRTRRKAKFEKNCFIAPWFEITPACGPVPVQFAAVIVSRFADTVGQLPVDAVNSSRQLRFSTASCAANTGAASISAVSPILKVSRQNATICRVNVGRLM